MSGLASLSSSGRSASSRPRVFPWLYGHTLSVRMWLMALTSFGFGWMGMLGAQAEAKARLAAPDGRTSLASRLLFQASVLEGHDAVHVAGELEVVGGDQGCDAGLAGQFVEVLEHRVRRRRIEVAGRLVGQQ